MEKLIRRLLLVLVLLAAAAPWIVPSTPVLAQEGEDTPAAATTRSTGLTVPTGGRIGIIDIHGPIEFESQLDSIKRRVDRAVNDGVDLIVFDLDTPGGALIVALDISQYIRTLQVPTVAWVNNRALSAGVLIASACDQLVMSKASLAGDCAPIIPGMNLAPTERAKALSPLLAEFRANAQDNYSGPTTNDYALFHAMCALGVEVYRVRQPITGEVRLVNHADYEVMVNGKSPVDAAGITDIHDSAVNGPSEFELVARATATVTSNAEVGQWELIEKVHDGSTLLTLYEVEALKLGLSRATVSSEAELLRFYGGATAGRYEETWSESLVGFLIHPVVRACLLLLGIVGILIEYFSPGLFIPGIIGVLALVTLVGAPFLVGLAQTWHLVLIVIGAALVIYEIFTMTTFGVLAVLGLLMFLTGLVLSGVQSATNGLPAPGSARQVLVTAMSFVSAIVLTIPMLILMTRYFGSLPILNKLVLTESADITRRLEGSAAPPQIHISGNNGKRESAVHVGMTGVVASTGLRPTGRMMIGDEPVEVTSTGDFIEPGTSVRVVEIQGYLIYVEPVESA